MNKGIKLFKWLESKYTYYDVMEPLWDWYHKWILHKGMYHGIAWSFLSCDHMNPFHVLTPRKLQKQIDNIKKIQ